MFVSSVVNDYEHMREAARRGVIAAGMDPVLANEDFPSLITSSRNACLDGIASCDVHLSIIGRRGGWTTPSGLTVVEEEFDFAKVKKLPILVFLEDGDRDDSATRFAATASDYVTGKFRVTFDTPASLEAAIALALSVVGPSGRANVIDHAAFASFPLSSAMGNDQAIATLRLAPVRNEELISPQQMRASQTEQMLYEIGHRPSVALFSYTNRKTPSRAPGALTILEQGDKHGEMVSVAFTESGVLDVSLAVPKPRPSARDSFTASLVVPVEDLSDCFGAAFAFYSELLSRLDQWQRHQQFFMNAALVKLGYRTLERQPQTRASHTMRMNVSNAPLLAYQSPRLVSRADLANPRDEVDRAVELIVRQAAG